MSKEEKIKLFNTVLDLTKLAQEPTYDKRNYFEQSEGAYKMLSALGIESEYIHWSIDK